MPAIGFVAAVIALGSLTLVRAHMPIGLDGHSLDPPPPAVAADPLESVDAPTWGALPVLALDLSVEPRLAAESPVPASAIEQRLFDLTNADRAAHGLPRLEMDAKLLSVARQRAADQAPESPLSHYDVGGQVVFSRLISRTGLHYSLAGENLARVPGPEPSAAQRAEDALMQSPSHRANILEPTFDRLAVGTIVDTRGRIVFAQIFRAARTP